MLLALALTDAEHFRAARGAYTLRGRFAVFHRDRFGVFHLSLRSAFHTVRFHLSPPLFGIEDKP